MTNRLSLLALAISLTTVVLLPGVSADPCEEPAGGVEVCQVSDMIRVTVQSDDVGSAQVTLLNRRGDFHTTRGAKVDAATVEDSAVGANELHARALCVQDHDDRDPGDDEPCNDAFLFLAGGDEPEKGLSAGLRCEDAFAGETRFCEVAWVSGGAQAGEEGFAAGYMCGEPGFDGEPCPREHSAGADVGTREGDAGVAAGYAPPLGASVCEEDPATGGTCLP